MPTPSNSRKPKAVRSAPKIPEGLVPLDEWAESKGLTAVCVRKWVWAGRLTAYRVPGYGNRAFLKPAEAERLLRPAPAPSSALLK